jgi:hypothetical protein
MDPFSQVLSDVTRALQRNGIRYAIGGSVASSVRGVWRTTFDVDLVAAIRPVQAQQFADTLGPDWYADASMIRNAIESGRSFNIIHTRLAYKVDIFPAGEDFHVAQLDRATTVPIGAESVPCLVTSAEDILLAKLRWYRDGGQNSERQWNDIAALISSNSSLDAAYLREWATRLGVTDLLEKARADAARA